MKRCSLGWFAIPSAKRLAGVLALALVAGCAARDDPPVRVLASASRAFDEPTAEAEPRSLPDTWSAAQRGAHQRAFYTAELDLEEVPREAWSVYLARADTNARVLVNGRSLGGVGRLESPPSRLRHRPLLFPIDPGLLVPGRNRVTVELLVEPTSSGALSRIEVGPTARLAGKRAWRHFFQITWIQLAAFLAAILIVVVGTVYGSRGRGTSYRWFQLSVAFWIVYACEIWIPDPPWPARYWEATANGAQYLSIWAIMMGFHRALDEPRVRVEVTVGVAIAFAIALYLVVPEQYVWPLRAALGVGICAVAGFLVDFVKNSPAAEEWVLEKHHVAAGVLGVGAGVHDIASAPFGWPFSGYWLTQHTGALAVVFTLAAIMRHLISGIRVSHSLGRDLELRFAMADRELADRFARIRTIENAQMIDRERERLTRGLHEGVGSVLMSTIATVEGEAPTSRSPSSMIADRIRDALDDLRLVIDSLRPEESLLDMLARLRSRLAARFERRGIEIAWQVADTPELRGLEAEHALLLLRILQDLFRGTERMAGVRRVTVRTGCEARDGRDGIYVEIEGDCRGELAPVDEDALQRRALAIGGAIESNRGHSTTATRLWLPLELPEVSRA